MRWKHGEFAGRYYVLGQDGQPVAETDVARWAAWFENTDLRRLALTKVGPARVSTVFLGLDHSYGGDVPVLWETCCFDVPDGSDHMQRYTSRDDAVRGHNEVCAEIRELLGELRP